MRSVQEWHRRYQQQARWTQQARSYLARQLKFAHAKRILDIGCGTGALFPDLQRATSARLVGLDIELTSLQFAQDHAPQAALTCGDAFHLPFAHQAFDIVVCHFLLLWLPDPAQALAEMVRVIRPGGAVCILAEPDYGGRIDYPPQFEEIGRLQMHSLEEQGADPRIGRKLPSLLAQSGLHDTHVALIGGHWSAPPDPKDWSSEWTVLEEDLHGRLSENELSALRRQDSAAWKNGERLLYVPTFYAWGSKPS
jgi:SAM-dependent methyltransferase